MNQTLKRMKRFIDALVEENEEDTEGKDEWDDTLNPFFSNKDAQDKAKSLAEAVRWSFSDDSDGFDDE